MSVLDAARTPPQARSGIGLLAVLSRTLLALPISVYLVVFALIPLSTLLLYSFWTGTFLTTEHDLTLDNYRSLVTDQRDVFVTVLRRTVVLAAVVTLVSLLIGFPTAYYLARHVRRFQTVALLLLFVPLSTSYLVKVYAWRGVLGERGMINYSLVRTGLLDDPLGFLLFNRFAVGLALVSAVLPFMVLPLYSSIERIPNSLLDAASDLGAGSARTFWQVIVPLTRRGIIAGCTFVFILSLGDFIASQLLGGTSGLLIGKVIYSSFGLAGNWPEGAAMAFAVLFTAGLALALLAWIARRGGGEGDVTLDSQLAR